MFKHDKTDISNNMNNNHISNNIDRRTNIFWRIHETYNPIKLKSVKRKRLKIISLVLVLCFIASYFQPFAATVFAAPRSINVYVDDFSQGKLTLRWNAVAGGNSVKITYHSPISSNPYSKETIILNQTTNKADIPNLLNDIVYDFDIIVYSDINANGMELARGFLYFLPRVTFEAKIIKQNYVDLPGGGREIGIDPGITLEWSIPRVWDETSGEFRYINEGEVIAHMEGKLNEVYSGGTNINKINYRINISTDSTKLNSSPEQAGIIIEPGADDDEFYSYVSGSQDVKSKVRISASTGKMSLDVLGRKDKNAELPPAADYKLPHKDILPGTVYYMNIKLMFFDDTNQPINVLTTGAPKDMNGSPLTGNVSYIFTPIRFQLTRDNYNNVFVKIYRINQGSLDLPRLYYEIQTSDDPTVQGDWMVRRRIDDTYFIGGYANTVISDINPNNEIYYKIVVKSDNVDDRLESSPMPYILYMDTSRPPVPLNVSITEKLPVWQNVTHPITQEEIRVKSTDVTFTWEMPEDFNWNQEKDNLYFHFMISTNQVDLSTSTDLKIDGKYWGTYPVKYRLVRYVSANSPNIMVNGNRISYTLKGFELFKGEGDDGQLNKIIQNPDNYPDFLLPNRIYYVQMYTTRAADAGSTEPDRMSDISIVRSFTTLPEIDQEVPAPLNVVVDKNEIYTDSENNIKNRVELLFNKVNIDWRYYTSDTNKQKAVYYDLYMSTRTASDSFVKIGSTEYTDRDVKFIGADDPTTATVRVSISQFRKDVNKYDPDDNPDTDNDIDPYVIFGSGLKPNTTYYFILKTRLVIEGEKPDKESVATPIVSVTTLKGDIEDPDEEARKPLAPNDFSISTDAEGNLEITGSSVKFKWTRLEESPVYEIICTSERIASDAVLSDYENDPLYKSFIAHYGNKDSDGKSNTFILDPEKDLNTGNFKDKFLYDNTTGTFTLLIDEWIYPNRLYYFSIRAVIRDDDGDKVSAWVTIPVTTSLIEMPLHIEAVIDYEIAFFWQATDPDLGAEDYTIYILGPEDADFKEVSRTNVTITKDGDWLYARIRKLKSDTMYAVKVYAGNNRTRPVYEDDNLKTRDGCHEFEVRWVGKERYDYEIAVLRENDSEYIILEDEDLQPFADRYNREMPYYVEKTPQTRGTDNSQYLARVKSIPQRLPDGTIEHIPVESNTKYYIKVRAVRVDPLDSTIVSYSKYIGPVYLRTEFSQEDYDHKEDEKKKEDLLKKRIDEFEEKPYWIINTWNSSEFTVLLKGERVANYIENTAGTNFILDIKDIPEEAEISTIYIPKVVADTLISGNKSMDINLFGGVWTLRPRTLDVLKTSGIKEVLDKKGVVEPIFELRISYTNLNNSTGLNSRLYGHPQKLLNEEYYGFPQNTQLISHIYNLELKVEGMSKSYKALEESIRNKLYNKDSGMVQEKTEYFKKYNSSLIKDNDKINEYINGIVLQMEKELAVYIQNLLDAARVKDANKYVDNFGSPMILKLPFINTGVNNISAENNGRDIYKGDYPQSTSSLNANYVPKGVKSPYVYEERRNTWIKIIQNLTWKDTFVTFTALVPGRYAVLEEIRTYDEIPADYPDRMYITEFISKYDVNKIFQLSGGSIYLEEPVSVKEAILLYEAVMNREYEATTTDIKVKAKELGIDNIINPNTPARDVTRQQAAALVAKVYSIYGGVDLQRIKISKYGLAKDEDRINDKFYKSVMFLLEKGIMRTNSTGYFEPDKSISRGEIMAAFAKTLEQVKR